MMKKKDRLFRRYAYTLTALLCIFGLVLGVVKAQNNTAALTKGEASRVITEKQVTDFLQQQYRSAADKIRQIGYLL